MGVVRNPFAIPRSILTSLKRLIAYLSPEI